jgi:DNA-binding MarR family transcriptional regulator/predicted GNAT family acetyltransferase
VRVGRVVGVAQPLREVGHLIKRRRRVLALGRHPELRQGGRDSQGSLSGDARQVNSVELTQSNELARDVSRFRAFNRTTTMVVGALDEHLLESSYTLTEARVLFELGTRSPLAVSELRDDLRLDPGYLSRILSSFEGRGYVRRRRAEHDARFQVAELTPRGRKVYRELDWRSSQVNSALLAKLPVADRERLLAATDDVRALLSGTTANAVGLREERVGDFGRMIERHGVIYAGEYGWDHTLEGFVAEILGDFVRERDPARERAWVAELDGRRAGAVLCTREDEETAKLRTLFVERWARGHGIGTQLVDACISFARQAGYERLMLWTHDILVEARYLYEKAGFHFVDEGPLHAFGQDLVEQIWALELDGDGRVAPNA